VISGREFTEADTAESQLVAVVNQAFVDRYWPGANALGKQVTDGGDRFTIVGVARNAKYRLLTYPTEPVIYFPSTRPIARHMTPPFTSAQLAIRVPWLLLWKRPSISSIGNCRCSM